MNPYPELKSDLGFGGAIPAQMSPEHKDREDQRNQGHREEAENDRKR
jgi:hypothetical protein